MAAVSDILDSSPGLSREAEVIDKLRDAGECRIRRGNGDDISRVMIRGNQLYHIVQH